MKMIFKNINILDENFEIMEGGYLATESGKISYVGEKKKVLLYLPLTIKN